MPLLPLLLAAYPVLQLHASNTALASPWAMVRPLALGLLGALALFAAARVALGSTRKAELLSGLALALFWWPAPVMVVLETLLGIDPSRGPPGPLVVAVFLALLVGFGGALRREPDASARLVRAQLGARLVAAVLGLGALLQGVAAAWSCSRDPFPTVRLPAAPRPERRPDVWYVILDAYARADVLRDVYGFDNGPFLERLAALGFQVTPRSRSNYAWTLQSLASSLNLGYVVPPPEHLEERPRDEAPMATMIRDPLIRRFFASQGYETASVASGAQLLDHTAFDTRVNSSLTETENLLLRFSLFGELFPRFAFANRRRQLDRALAALAPPPEGAPPRFTLLHVLAPHPPFVWDAEGEPAEPFPIFDIHDNGPVIDSIMGEGWYRARYREQLQHLNDRLLARLEALLSDESREAVVLLQGDHGPLSHSPGLSDADKFRERFGILNAYRVPSGVAARLYPGISPVNTFRVLLDGAFGTSFGVLPDRALYNEAHQPYAFFAAPPE